MRSLPYDKKGPAGTFPEREHVPDGYGYCTRCGAFFYSLYGQWFRGSDQVLMKDAVDSCDEEVVRKVLES